MSELVLRRYPFPEDGCVVSLMGDGDAVCTCKHYDKQRWCRHSMKIAKALDEGAIDEIMAGIESASDRLKTATERQMKKKITRTWQFRSSTNQNLIYTTVKYFDGTFSCNRKGWCNHVANDGSRSCKHTREAKAEVQSMDNLFATGLPQFAKPAPVKVQGKSAKVRTEIKRRYSFNEE